ncbi:MAG: phenylalanine--tRNA ligase subunit beta, partial [Acetobacterales bacterium]
MKFTLGWLKDHLETNAGPDAIVERLSMIGLEVEGVSDRAARFSGFVIGHVVEARQHPNADRLRVCIVDNGRETVQVVCGAPNARTGMKGVFAPSGSYIPGTGIDLKASQIRGEDSNGMLLSERELGLSEDHDGIVDLPEDAPLGASYATWAGYDDPVIEIAITPNRADCLGVRGVARDLAAAGLGRLKPDPVAPTDGVFDSPVAWHLDFPEDARDACPFVVGRTIRNLKNGPSPEWVQSRLRGIGLRPISALVDVTNYIAFDRGRPLHVYDLDKLHGDLTI